MKEQLHQRSSADGPRSHSQQHRLSWNRHSQAQGKTRKRLDLTNIELSVSLKHSRRMIDESRTSNTATASWILKCVLGNMVPLVQQHETCTVLLDLTSLAPDSPIYGVCLISHFFLVRRGTNLCRRSSDEYHFELSHLHCFCRSSVVYALCVYHYGGLDEAMSQCLESLLQI